jgi:hypothetical protein
MRPTKECGLCMLWFGALSLCFRFLAAEQAWEQVQE